MKTAGSTGKTSRTLVLHGVFGALQSGLGLLQVIQGILTPEQYVMVAMVITGLHSAIGWKLRQVTTGPLQ